MADPATDQVTVAVILFAVALAVFTFFELRFLRKRMKNRRVRTAKRDEELSDEAHNTIVTTKAILAALERQGIRSEESASWLREAETAATRRNYRVAIDLTAKAKGRLLALKSAQASKGDLAKLDRLPRSSGSDEITTKEIIQKDGNRRRRRRGTRRRSGDAAPRRREDPLRRERLHRVPWPRPTIEARGRWRIRGCRGSADRTADFAERDDRVSELRSATPR